MVAGGRNPIVTLTSAMLNQMMRGLSPGHVNVVGGSTNECGTSVPPPNAAAAPVKHQQARSVQLGWSVFKADVTRVGAATTSHKFWKQRMKGKLDGGGNDSK